MPEPGREEAGRNERAAVGSLGWEAGNPGSSRHVKSMGQRVLGQENCTSTASPEARKASLS